MYLVSSPDLGRTWTLETSLEIERDMREPYFLEVNGTLFFYYFEAGTNPIKFEPGYLQVWSGIGDVSPYVKELPFVQYCFPPDFIPLCKVPFKARGQWPYRRASESKSSLRFEISDLNYTCD